MTLLGSYCHTSTLLKYYDKKLRDNLTILVNGCYYWPTMVSSSKKQFKLHLFNGLIWLSIKTRVIYQKIFFLCAVKLC
jgi:hypothetical protein